MRYLVNKYVLALACGVVLALSFPGWHLYPFAWVALAPLFYRAHRLTPGQAFKVFFVAGWAFYAVLLQWLITNIYWAGGWALWGYQGVCVVMALYWGVFGALWAWTHGRLPRVAGALAVAVLWAAMEFLQGRLFTGFGWGALAYSQGNDLMLLQCAALGGAGLVGAILVFFNALVGLAFAEKRLRAVRVAGAVAVLAVSHGVGALLLNEADYTSKPFRAGLLQADFPLEMKWDWEYTEEMVRNAAEKSQWLAQYEPVDLFVWPESLVMDDLEKRPSLLAITAALTRETQCPLFTGASRDKPGGGTFNSSVLVDPSGAITGHYDKVHLAPFGEYVPLSGYFPFIQKIVPAIGEIQHGHELTVLPAGDRRFGPLICFEVLFPELAEELRRRGADIIVVITNLGWFGASPAIPQELEIARVRAVETRLPLVHCANTGISGVFDPWGRFTAVNTTFDLSGNYVQYPYASPIDMRMQRCVGALPVAAPGPRPIPHGPAVFPWIAIGGGTLLLAAALVSMARGGKKTDTAQA